jgi:HAD superfamily hydrolase (TIGR01509 family)
MALSGFIFDLDGVLIDSNPVHIDAWKQVLERAGFRVASDRLLAEMGKGGDKLIPSLLGVEVETDRGEALRAEEAQTYASLALARGLPVSPGAGALIDELRRRGLRMALATSSDTKQLDVAERASGVKWRTLMDEVICATDVAETKPAPDLVQLAVERLGLSPAQCAMVGDTPWDARSANPAGVVAIGVTRGGNTLATLLGAGARLVYADPADILRNLDDALRIVSPGSASLDARTLDHLMMEALRAAEQGMAEGEVPIGCVIANGAAEILAAGHNTFNRTRDRTAHAEMEAFRSVAGRLPADARDTILVSTLEPCVMCTGAAMEVAVDTIVYALEAPPDGGSSRVTPPTGPEGQRTRIVGGVRATESRALFQRWLALPARNRAQEPFVQQLLSSTRERRS